ncbi:peptidase domain-containing ABC transporter [Streptomyces sp. NPDC017979]|uniref:peptidase domain-containing ABC transporter n=1 Tax=Streptomyces sp. NPDC017979 TaxID=3365024 RepID=UPI003791784D
MRLPRPGARPRRVPTTSQVAQTECGLCCCVSVLRFHGRTEDVTSARRDLDAGRDGLGAGQLGRFLRSRGMDVRTFRVGRVDLLRTFSAPVILFWEERHFVVLERFDGRRAVVMDPAVGRRRLSRAELEAGFSGIALLAEPGADFTRLRPRPLHEWRGLPLLAAGSRRRLAAVALLTLGGYGAVLGIPLLTRWGVDQYTRWGGGTDGLAVVLALILVAAAAHCAIQLVRVVLLSTVVTLLGRHLMTHTFRRLLSLPLSVFSTRSPGELLFRLNSVNMVRDLLSSRAVQGALDLGTLLCVSIYLFTVEWRLGSIATLLFLGNAGYLALTRTRVQEAVDAEINWLSRSQSAQLDAIVSMPTIKMGGYAERFLKDWGDVYDASLDAMRTRMRLQQGRIMGISGALQLFGPVVMLFAGLSLVGQGRISLGAAIAVQAVSASCFALAGSVFQTYIEFTEATRHMARLKDINETPPEPPGGTRPVPGAAVLRLDGVSFRYTRDGTDVIADVHLEVAPGSRIALVGASGSGKSTLGRVVCGLYEPTRGTVRLGGHALSEYPRDQLRRRIGYIPQEVHLHNRTILENLTLGLDVSRAEAEEFCRTTGLLGFLDDLPMGLDTLVAEMGTNFSGGQRQRIALVRALLRRPSFLLLDEATSALDSVNERRVTALTERLGVTQVVIAHRLSTVHAADRIHVLHRGRIVQSGTHHELLTPGTHYHALYTSGAPGALVGGE